MTRRRFLGGSLVAAASPLVARFAQGQGAASPLPGAPGVDPNPVGRIQPVPSRAIEASPLSVGFETLDRQHFDPVQAYPHLANLGVKWARCQTGWNRCEPEAGRYEFGWLDEVVDSLLGIGIQPWFNLGYGNPVHVPGADATGVGWAPVFDAGAREAWVRFVERLAAHFAERVRHWEIWNEPNITGFWKPEAPDPADYADLVALTAPLIRSRVPGAAIVGGAFAGVPVDYARGCFEAGLAEHVDRISYHPYRPVPDDDSGEGQVRQLQDLVGEYDPDILLWQGENGCPSKGGGDSTGALSNLEWDELRQAKWLLRRILTDLRLGVELTSYFHTVDLVGYRGKTNYKGLLRGANYTPKPAYFAYQCLCALFDARTRLVDIPAEVKATPGVEAEAAASVRHAGFSREGTALLAYWHPANLQTGWTPGVVEIALQLSAEARMEEPVLVDPLNGNVQRLTDVSQDGATLTARGLPLLDYPLIVADRSVQGEAG